MGNRRMGTGLFGATVRFSMPRFRGRNNTTLQKEAVMPIREYIAVDPAKACAQCRPAFEHIEAMDAEALATCPACGQAVHRQISSPSIGGSQSGLDQRAKNAGFTKLEKLGHGEYEKKY